MFRQGEIIVDNFAGGGGASEGIEEASGRPVDIAINHDPEAVAMHSHNHPWTEHYCQDVWKANPLTVTRGRPVGLAWFSPDCKHFSKAKGGKPVEKKIRDLAWVVIRWADVVRPRVIMLENVEEFRDWGPLVTTEDGKQFPCPLRKGLTFRRWVRELERRGYVVEHRDLRACDYGTPTIRKRLFLIARCDGQPIVWPAPTHGPGRLPYLTAADCIDWSIPAPSIFGRKKPLAENTQRRIANGLRRYVLECGSPFIVPVTHTGDARVHGVDEPFRTVTSAPRGELALVTPHLTKFRTGSVGSPIDAPVPTVTANSYIKRPGGAVPIGLVAAFLAKHYGGHTTPGWPLEKPASTVTAVDHHALVTSYLTKFKGTCRDGQSVTDPMPTVQAGGNKGGGHVAEVRAFLIKYYGDGGQHQACTEPMHTITSKARLGLVTVAGVDYQIVDIGMRMLTARELYRAQGFPDHYQIDFTYDGAPLTKTAQIRMCGNSVCPPMSRALVAANFGIELPAEAVA